MTLTNHLGNVLALIGDCKQKSQQSPQHRASKVVNLTDYYPFGMEMPGRSYAADVYRYGFNGMEKDDELKGSGNSYDFGARMYDSRIGRWMTRDPHQLGYPSHSSYNYVLNNPILINDVDGRDAIVLVWAPSKGFQGHVAIAVMTYKEVNGQLEENGYVIYEAAALGSNDPSRFVDDPAKIVDGVVTSTKAMSKEEVLSYQRSTKADVAYLIHSSPKEDIYAKAQLDPMQSDKQLIDNPDYDPYSSEVDEPPKIEVVLDPIQYSLLKNNDCNVVSCAGLVSLILDEAYGIENIGIESIDVAPSYSVFGIDVGGFSGIAITPNMLQSDLAAKSRWSGTSVQALTSTMRVLDFLNAFTGGDTQDQTPGR